MGEYKELLINCIRNREQLPEPTIGLRSLLKAEGTEGYIKLCVKCISEAGLIDGDTIDIDISDPYNLLMTYNGIEKGFGILNKYCDENRLNHYISRLIDISHIFKLVNEQLLYYKLLDNKTLRKMKDKMFTDQSVSPDEADKISFIATEELNARKIHNLIYRKINIIIERIRVLWKYRKTVMFLYESQDIERKH